MLEMTKKHRLIRNADINANTKCVTADYNFKTLP